MNAKKLTTLKGKNGSNKVIFLLTLSDILVWGTSSIASPLLAIYLSGKFGGNTVEYIGIGTAIYFAVRSIVQLPIGMLTDRIKHDKDEIFFLMLGCILMGIPYLLYSLVTEANQYYVLMGLGGLGASMNLNNWRKLFAKNLDKNKEGYQYGIYETVMSISTAVFGLLGGYFGNLSPQIFEAVITSVGFFVFSGGIIAFSLLWNRRKSY